MVKMMVVSMVAVLVVRWDEISAGDSVVLTVATMVLTKAVTKAMRKD